MTNLCNRCYEKSKEVFMRHVGKTKPRKILGNVKDKWKCPECGYMRTGNGPSYADMKKIYGTKSGKGTHGS